MNNKQSGFTLIEIAIVLVIIGLLLGGVLKGQELINSAKVKNLATDFKNIPVFMYGYQDKYRAMPGDDATIGTANTHITGASAPTTTTSMGSGVIDGKWNDDGLVETNLFWQHVRMAGLAPGPTAAGAGIDLRPNNAVGGFIGITNAASSPISTLNGSFIVCSSGIAGKFAKQLDITMDDGNTAAGSMRTRDSATPGTATGATATADIVDDTPYIVCMGY